MHASQAQLAAANVDRPGSSAGISVDTWDELAVLTLDGRGMICDCNYAGEALFGYLLSELVWRHVALLLPQFGKLKLMREGQINPHRYQHRRRAVLHDHLELVSRRLVAFAPGRLQ